MKKTSSKTEARFAYDGLDRVIHERARLSVVTSLMTHPTGLSFVELKQLCGLTDGNLARHLQVLEAVGIVVITKQDDGSRMQTIAKVTAAGRKRFLEYLTVLEQVVQDAAAAQEQKNADQPAHKLSALKI